VLSSLLSQIELQSVAPAEIIVSACDAADVPALPVSLRTRVILGPPGLTVQRNRALDAIPPEAEIVVFFDDDFVPSRKWIEHAQTFFVAHCDAVCVTGHVLAEGNKTGGIAWRDGLAMVENADKTNRTIQFVARVVPNRSPYGCNMAFRWPLVKELRFDERLPLHGWLEDRDFGVRAMSGNRTGYWTDSLWGVHLGSRSSRVSQTRFGYAQIVNPWYLMKKGAMTTRETATFIGQGLVFNMIRLVIYDPHANRLSRLRGNFQGIADILTGRWRPERVTDIPEPGRA
jgi:hypothetical protein